MTSALVSVIIATYRRDSDLTAALESLAKQTFKNFEIILVDDNACDEWNSKVTSIVNRFRNNYPGTNIHYIINSPNRGSAETRNIGIKSSNGEYITFLDDDDVYLPNKIKNQIDFMIRGNYDYSITDLALYSENGKQVDMRNRNYIKDTSVGALLKYHLLHHLTGTDTMMFRKDYLLKIGGFAPIDIGDEFYLMLRAIENGGTFGYLRECDVKAYVHTNEGGLSSGIGKITGENALYEYKKQYFNNLNSQERRYVKMRHYAVLAIGNLRLKRYAQCALYCCRALLVSPCDCFNLLFNSQKTTKRIFKQNGVKK